MRITKTTTILALAASLTAIGAQAGLRAVPTYESLGVYWTNPGTGADCAVQFRASGASTWTQGLDLWYDARNDECRGSLVSLAPGTTYEVQAGPKGGAMTQSVSVVTWANTVPVAKTISVGAGSGTLTITEGGSAGGYVVYDGHGATLDAANAQQFNVQVSASYVVIRNLVLKGARFDGIRIDENVHDVIIEDNDISGWGDTRDGTWGADMNSAVRAICKTAPTLERVTIQRNRIHDPRWPANSWSVSHPWGPQGISFSWCGGNHVFRHNEIYSTNGNHYNDGIGGEDNFSQTGFPNLDSDIYGNVISQTYDDGIEAEGGNKNVRVWGNYIDQTGTGVASTVVSIGPMYIWRNVWNRNQFLGANGLDQDDRQPMMKAGSDSANGHGRRYVFHNTMLQPTQGGYTYPLGGGYGMGGAGVGIWNTISKNNIWNTWKKNTAFYETQADSSAERDMYNGTQGDMKIVNGINATPSFTTGNALVAGSAGHDQGVRIPNFNDGYVGAAPDVGAVEAGAAATQYGVAASPGSAVSGSSGGGTGVVTPPAGGNTGGSGTTTPPSGTQWPSATMDSSAYTSAAGQSVTFTARILGTSATPSGTVGFTANGAAIAGCGNVGLAGGAATCTTNALPSGTHQIVGAYSGDVTYGVAKAGPITQLVTGSAPSGNDVNVQGLWWAGAGESGWGLNVVHQGTTLFVSWFTYDAQGNPQWLVMSSVPKTGTNTYAGPVYRTTGPAFNPASFDSSKVTNTQVGTASFSFSSAAAGQFNATVDGTSVSKAITRLAFDARQPVCSQSDPGGAENYQDLWWKGNEPGWGINLAHQGDTLFMAWFTYDANGKATWYYASSVAKQGDGSFRGTLYRNTGPALGSAWNVARVNSTAVGSVSFVFDSAASGTFYYTLDGVSNAKMITRDVYATPATVCRG